MASLGLLAAGGIGNALSQGVDSYMQMRKLKRDEEKDQRGEGLLAASKNLELDPETNQYGLNQFGQQQQQGLLAKQQADLESEKAHTNLYGAQADFYRTGKKDAANQKADDAYNATLRKIKSYSEAENGESQASNIISLIENAKVNPAAAASLPTELGLYASHGQRLHGATIEAFGKPDSSIMGGLANQLQSSKSGTITPETAQNLINYVSVSKESAAKEKRAIEKREAEKFKKQHNRYPSTYNAEEEAPASTQTKVPDLKNDALAELQKRRAQKEQEAPSGLLNSVR